MTFACIPHDEVIEQVDVDEDFCGTSVEPVDNRLVYFVADFPNGGLVTSLSSSWVG